MDWKNDRIRCNGKKSLIIYRILLLMCSSIFGIVIIIIIMFLTSFRWLILFRVLLYRGVLKF